MTSDPRSAAWRALVEAIQYDPIVASLGILWLLPEDQQADDPAPRDGITVRIGTVTSSESRFYCGGDGKSGWECAVQLPIEIHIAGESADNALNVWDTINRAAQTAERQLVLQNLIAWLDDPQPAIQANDSDSANGLIAFTLYYER